MKRLMLSLFCSLPLGIIRLFAFIDISQTGIISNDQNPIVVYVQGVVLFVGAGFLFWCLLSIEKGFIPFYIFGFLGASAFSIFLALNIHRDFFTYSFMLLGLFYMILISKADLLFTGKQRRQTISYLYWFSIVFFVLIFQWVIFMGYSITTRAEPRWIESIVYNIYNLIYGFLLIFFIIDLKSKTYNQLVLQGGKVLLEGTSLSNLLSDTECFLLAHFIRNRNKVLNCSNLIRFLERDDKECECCIEKEYNVSACPQYKYIYNRIHNIKRILAENQVGDILLNKESPRRQKNGWTFLVFENVQVKER